MKTIALFGCCLMLAACGNWSNEDLEYLNAMPVKEQLRSKLPTGTAGGLSGEGTRRDALGVGEPSKFYTDTKTGSDGFNGILDLVIGAVESVRTFPPTLRTDDSRIWGPWADKENPGFEVQVVIKKIDDTNFAYAFQYRDTRTKDPFFDVVTGAFKATATLRKGRGALTVHAAVMTSKLKSKSDDFKDVEKIEVGYVTDMFPVLVTMVLTGKPGASLVRLDYGYQELESKSGRIGFRATSTDANMLQFDVLSSWLASGAGVGGFTVVEGNFKGATHFECWDAAFKTVFVTETWPGGTTAGDQKNCVTVEGFPK